MRSVHRCRGARSSLPVLLIAITSCAGAPADSPDERSIAQYAAASRDAPPVAWVACPEDYRTECAWVPLPVDHDRPDGPALPIFVTRSLATSGAARAQLWLLEGGPGGSGRSLMSAVDELFAPILPDVDFYMLEHRGVGESARLGCNEFESYQSQAGERISSDEWPACVVELEAQWDGRLRHFTTTADAHDLASLIERTREPDKKIFVYGASYGTTRALRLLQTHPDLADGVILDSVVSPGIQFLSDYDTQTDPVARELAALCAADPVCGAKLGADPWSELQKILDKLDRGHCPEFLNRSLVRPYAATLVTLRALRSHIFPLFYRLDRCDPEDVDVVERYLAVADQLLSRSPGPLRDSESLQVHVALSELWEEPAPSLAELEQRCEEQTFCPGISHHMGSLYPFWPRYPRDAFVNQWPMVSTPILAMNGTLDPQTPIETASAAATELAGPHQTFVSVPLSSHGVVFSSPVKTAGAPPCGAQLLSSFIQDPTRDPDTSCLNDLLPVTFTASSKLDVQLFGTTDLWENSPPPQAAMPNDPAQAAAAALFDIQRTVAWGRWPVADAETSAR